MSVLIKDMKMPNTCEECNLESFCDRWIDARKMCGEQKSRVKATIRHPECPLVELSPHGKLIDADALAEDLKRQCEEVFKIDAVSPDDFWITRNQAYNERLWKTWCESFYKYLESRPTIIPADDKDINVLCKKEDE